MISDDAGGPGKQKAEVPTMSLTCPSARMLHVSFLRIPSRRGVKRIVTDGRTQRSAVSKRCDFCAGSNFAWNIAQACAADHHDRFPNLVYSQIDREHHSTVRFTGDKLGPYVIGTQAHNAKSALNVVDLSAPAHRPAVRKSLHDPGDLEEGYQPNVALTHE